MNLNTTRSNESRLTMPFHTINGKQVYYDIKGQGTPILMIHGSMSTHRVWDKQRILAKKYTLLFLDLPGHGQSEPLEGEITVQRFAGIVAQLIQKIVHKGVVVIGHSLGGAITLQLAFDHASLLDGLVLVGTGAKLGVLPAILEGLRTNYQAGIELATGQMAFAKGADLALVERCKDECLRCPQEVGYNDFVACNNFDVRERLSEIKVPSLVVVGDEDKLTPVKWSQYLAAHLQNAKLTVIELAGHMV
ncbi:MAG: alpha/beta fold hydrolase, partial [Promethearchaeota archaeon]